MKIEVLCFAGVREAMGKDRFELEVCEGTRVQEIVRQLKDRIFSPEHAAPSLLCAVNEEFISEDTILNDSDVLALMTPVSGGAA